MAQVRVTQYDSLEKIQHEGLREEAEGWQQASNITCGSAVVLPEDKREKPMEGFFDSSKGQGMVVWDDDMSDWIDADDLRDVFKNYVKDM